MLKWNRLKINTEIFWNKQPVLENILGKKIIIVTSYYYYYERSMKKSQLKRHFEQKPMWYWKTIM